MDKFLNIPLEEKTSTGNNVFNWEGILGDLLISISGKKTKKNKFDYIVYVDLCGYSESWWDGVKLKIAEAKGDDIKFIELEIKRQLNRFKNLL